MVRFMIRRPPIQEELTRVLDDIFRGVLDDGERTRAEREPGMPPWTPEAQTDPLYEDLDPEDWHRVPYPPDLWAQEWRGAILTNRLDDVATRSRRGYKTSAAASSSPLTRVTPCPCRSR